LSGFAPKRLTVYCHNGLGRFIAPIVAARGPAADQLTTAPLCGVMPISATRLMPSGFT
jgi:hypothetical protein